MFIKVALLVIFFAVTIGVGIYFKQRSNDVDGFVLGGRSIGPWLSAFSYGVSYFSAVVFVGYAGQFGWRFGTAAVWIGVGNAVIGAFLPWLILAGRTRSMTRKLNSKTMPEFFGLRYDSKALKVGASIIVFVFLVPYTASLYNGLSRLFSMAFNVDFTVCIIAMAVLTGIYVIIGGYVATSVNSFIQGIIMIVGIIAIITTVLNDNGGLSNALNDLSLIPDATGNTGVFTSIFGPEPLNLLGVVLLTSLGTWGLPQMVQKFYSIKAKSDIFKGTVITTVFSIIIAGGCYFLGGFGRLYTGRTAIYSDAGNVVFDRVIPEMLSNFPDILMGLTILLVFAASISTLAGLVMASASTFVMDFLKGNIIKNMNEKKQLISIRLLIVVFIAVSSIIAIVQYRNNLTFIAQLMGISWGALAGAFLAPFLYGLYWKRVNKIAVWCCFGFSTTVMTLNILFRDSFPSVLQSPINAGAFAMLSGLIIVPVVSLLTKAPDKKLVDNCFSYNEEDDK